MKKFLGRTYRKRKRRKLETSKNIDDCPKNDISYHSLCKWMGGKQYKPSKSLRPKYFIDTGRGLMTKEKIKPGDLLLTIPQNLLITPEVVLKSEFGTFFKNFCPKASGLQILSTFLMVEKSKGKASEWNPYIMTLPELYNIPAFYGHKCLKFLPSIIYERSLKQVELVENSYSQLDLLIKNLENAFAFPSGNLSLDLYKWAWCTVNTRCVYIDCYRQDCVGKSCQFHLAMAPFLDLLNHNAHVQVKAGFNTQKKQYEIISLCNFEKYSQVFINYGSHDNWTLFLEYGFVVPNNSNDSIFFSKDDILHAYKMCNFRSYSISEKLNFIEENALMRNLVCSCDGLSWNLDIILKILSTNYDMKWWKSRLHNELEFTAEDQNNFEKLRGEVLQLKIDELITSETVSGSYYHEYPSLQMNISQLFSMSHLILRINIKQ